jgi:tRNA G18 (ribose-2'-O)-methylase SpoU
MNPHKPGKKISMAELNRLSEAEYLSAPKIPVTVILDNIRSCHNTGSVFRTADALLIEKIILCGITATPLDAEKTVPWEYYQDTAEAVESLRKSGYRIYAVEQVEKSIPLPEFAPEAGEKIALVFGNEVKGVHQEVVNRCDGAIEIPQYGTKHSFNVSVSAGIVLWYITQKLRDREHHLSR